MAAAIGGALGGALGGAIGGAIGSQIGQVLGSMLGSYLFAPDLPDIVNEGPKLSDLKVTFATYGIPINRLYGTYRLNGNIIWATDIIEHVHTHEEDYGGKGGSSGTVSTVWYHYTCSWAVAICEGPIDSIETIWMDALVAYKDNEFGYPLIDGEGEGSVEFYLGTSNQAINTTIQTDAPSTPAYTGIAYLVFTDVILHKFGNKIPNVTMEVKKGSPTVATVIEDISLSTGLLSTDLNLTAGTSTNVTGYFITRTMTARDLISTILQAYFYVLTEDDFLLTLKPLQSTSVIPIDSADLGATVNENKIDNSIITITAEYNLFYKVTIIYGNPESGYQDASHTSYMNTLNYAQKAEIYEFPLALSDDYARQMTEMILNLNHTSKYSITIEVPSYYMNLVKTNDLISVELEAYNWTLRVLEINLNDQGNIEYKTVSVAFDETGSVDGTGTGTGYILSYNSDAIGDDTSYPGIADIQEPPGATIYDIFESPVLFNKHLYTPTVYAVATGSSANWRGCNIFSKVLESSSFEKRIAIINKTPQGVATTVLNTYNTYSWDRVNTVTVTSSNILFDTTEENMLNNYNYIMLGSEILQYKFAQDNGDGTYTLSTFIRGIRGTEWAVGTHSIGERFVFLDSGINYLYQPVSSKYWYTAISIGRSIVDTEPEIELINSGTSGKPFSPSYFRYNRTGDIINLQWMRRSRYITTKLNQAPLGENTEQYTLAVYDNSSTFVKDITDITNNNYTYDTIAEGINNPKFYVYQISATIGKGYPSSLLET